MKTYIHSNGLCIKSDIPIMQLLDCSLHINANCHGVLNLSCYIDQDYSLEDLERIIQNSNIFVSLKSDTNDDSNVFCGLIDTFLVREDAGVLQANIVARTGSIVLDRVARNRSFQNISMTYYELIDTVMSGTPNAIALHSAPLDRKIGKPLFQFAETDWEFIKRVSSHLHLSVVPDVQTPYPHISIGLPLSSAKAEFSSATYEQGYSYNKQYPKKDFFKVETNENFAIGDAITMMGRTMYICEKRANFNKFELTFQYVIANPVYIETQKYYNSHISGASLLGKVVQTSKETVNISLDIDSKNQGATYPYEWKPATGNIMYCMPQLGTKVSLYFPNSDEWSARAVSCVRSQETSGGGFSNPAKRGLHTEHGKFFDIDDDKLSMSSSGGAITLPDDSMVTLSSPKIITIVAEGNISIKSKKISVQVPFEIQMLQNHEIANRFLQAVIPMGTVTNLFCISDNTASSTPSNFSTDSASISLFSHLDILSPKGVKLYGTLYVLSEPYKDAPKAGEFDVEKFWWNVIGAVAVVVAITVVIASFGAASLAFVPTVLASCTGWGAIALGSFFTGVAAIGAFAFWDTQDGNVSNGMDYLEVASVSTVTAAGMAYFFPAKVLAAAIFYKITGANIITSANMGVYLSAEKFAGFYLGILESMLATMLLNYEEKTSEEIFNDSVTDTTISSFVGETVDVVLEGIFGMLAAYLKQIEFTDHILNTSRKSISKNGLSDLISMKDLKNLYKVHNVNELARMVHANPKILASKLMEEARKSNTIPTLNAPELAEEILKAFSNELASEGYDKILEAEYEKYFASLTIEELEELLN